MQRKKEIEGGNFAPGTGGAHLLKRATRMRYPPDAQNTRDAPWGPSLENVTSSAKPEVHITYRNAAMIGPSHGRKQQAPNVW